MTTEGKRLREACEADLPRISEVHLQAYPPNHFTSRLPAEVLRRYYSLFLGDGAETLLLVGGDEAGGETVFGFAVFGCGIGEKIARFKRDNAQAIVAASLRHPVSAARKVIHQLWNKVRSGRPRDCADHLLLSIAVAKPGAGAGRTLLKAVLARVAERGAPCVGLYVNADNLVAINAYIGQGFVFRELRGGQYYMERALEDQRHRL